MPQPRISPEDIADGLGAFDVVEFIDGGTFGDTFRVVRGDDEYALKVIMLENLPDYLWHRELEALGRVDHPNVVRLRDAGTFRVRDREYPYATCEYIVGGNIRDALSSGALAASPADATGLLTGLLSGVEEIHDLGILHRDIKPANVALRDGAYGAPVLLDFGLARVLDMSSHTQLPAHIGTPAYMAPEQLRGQAARRRSDLFAVGAVVYEAISGQHPFRRDPAMSTQAVHDQIKAGPVDRLQDLAPDCPEPVARVVERLLKYWAHERLGISEAWADLSGRS